jgi:pyruvate/2-oxoglutarate dehydrogenase complex dihydrolipoamide dehydrogenase (E3) component
VQNRFSSQLAAINRGFEKEGAFYLFGLRLVPLFPFFAVNLLMGLVPLPIWRFYWVSQLGMLIGTAVFVNAGTQLAELDGLSGILSPGLLGSFVLLGIFPLLAKKLLGLIERQRVLGKWDKPSRFDTNVVVIGAGSAGLVSSLIAATVKASVVLVERDRMGGDCLNTGCVPSKALIRSARINDYVSRGTEFGLEVEPAKVDFPAVMRRIQRVVAAIEPHDSVARYTEMGVDCVKGEARILSPWVVSVDGREISARHIIIASGARPFVPPIPGLETVDYLTSDNLWELTTQPGQLLIMGAGPIGCELAQAFARLGTQVTLVDMADRLMPREDPDVSEHVARRFESNGISVHTGHRAVGLRREDGQQWADFEVGGEPVSLPFERILVAIGRRANTEGMGLDELGITRTPTGTIAVNDYLQTAVPTIYACGDVVGPYQFTHMASHQAWFATVNALFGWARKFKVDYSVVPWATFTDPEVARVGLSETEATEQGVAYELSRFGIDDLDRAIADGEAHGFIKVLTRPGSDKILGATIVGYHAAELLAEYVLAMKHGLGLSKIMATIHVYPTLSEANKFVAGEWRKARKPERLLAWVKRYHDWRRG